MRAKKLLLVAVVSSIYSCQFGLQGGTISAIRICWPHEEFEFSKPMESYYYSRYKNNRPFTRFDTFIPLLNERAHSFPFKKDLPYYMVEVKKSEILVKTYYNNDALFYSQEYSYDTYGHISKVSHSFLGWKIIVLSNKTQNGWQTEKNIFNPSGKLVGHYSTNPISVNEVTEEQRLLENKVSFEMEFDHGVLKKYRDFDAINRLDSNACK